MLNVQYSILCNYPSIVSKDCLTLGILFHDRTNNICEFKIIKKWQRLKAFNDELDIDIVKLQLEAIKEEVQESASKGNFNLKDYTKFYVNELKFTEVVSIDIDEDFQDFINACIRQYMPLDLEKGKRPNNKEQIEFIKYTMKNSNISYNKGNVTGYFNESLKFDFIIDDYAFKVFKFENKDENSMIRNVKKWAYDAYKLSNDYKVVFVTDIDFSSGEYNILYNILKEESAKLITFVDVISFIQNLNIKTRENIVLRCN
ncbi:TPA: DUF3037 domain-containing protein [Clostridioides difficile]|uniref:DUF3037 domain-containing protein n=1 Tax=Clostridioides difficile TaxID=1496 RepID=UPI00097FED0E|nr:DUF3037 domain-containing protein [Clostridioides difficile]EGT3817430.1 DUF3037 domain-containing protein [Clostridioides difficile]EGT3828373.1 DUF3037 domain-containing protein [Clostridioides difficile]EGT4890989.1 DUF3037 domain-containing protein [Clostridioides difficile]EKS6800480.1 DUF3037 domain-containing protein [Clostridioides difficile]EKS7167072.1 DUF3037 domain-containing protein [Clostridioides difficile]